MTCPGVLWNTDSWIGVSVRKQAAIAMSGSIRRAEPRFAMRAVASAERESAAVYAHKPDHSGASPMRKRFGGGVGARGLDVRSWRRKTVAACLAAVERLHREHGPAAVYAHKPNSTASPPASTAKEACDN